MDACCFENLFGMRWCLYLAGIQGQQTLLKTQKSGFSFKERKKNKTQNIYFPKQCQSSSCFPKHFSSLISVVMPLVLASCQIIGDFSPLSLSSVFGNTFTIGRTANNPTVESRQTAFCFTVWSCLLLSFLEKTTSRHLWRTVLFQTLLLAFEIVSIKWLMSQLLIERDLLWWLHVRSLLLIHLNHL